MLLHLVKETDKGIIVRGAKYETAAAYANQAFVKPTIANWGDDKLSDYALGFICDMGAPGMKHICRTGFAGKAPTADYPLSNKFDEVDTLLIFDDVLIPWENVLFYRHTKAAMFIRMTLHRYSAYAFVQRTLKVADMMIGAGRPPAGRKTLTRRVVPSRTTTGTSQSTSMPSAGSRTSTAGRTTPRRRCRARAAMPGMLPSSAIAVASSGHRRR